ncbi:MAG: glycosyltransferase, partial [Candidatus Paceibacterota bacterium]
MTWRYIVNPAGIMTEVSQEQFDKLIKKKGFQEAPDSKVESYKFQRQVKADIQSAPSIYLKTTKDKKDGYGESQEWLIDALALEGINLTPEYAGQKVGMVYGYPHHLQNLKTPIKVLYSMFESTKIPEEWTQYLKLADKIFVPTKFCQEAFKARGFESTVVPLGYDHYEYIDRDFSQPFTFLHYDAFNTRKGWDILFQAFTEEFTTDEAQLVLKTIRRPLPITKKDYPNVRVVAEVMEVSDMKELLADAHCFVFPSRGEGFGIPPLEALATGIPAIIPNRTGMSEYFNDKYFLELDTDPRKPIYEKYKEDVGVMYEVRKESLRKQLRWAYENKDKIEQMGLKGSEWVKKYHIRNTAKRLKKEFATLTGTNVKTNRQKLAFIMDNINFYSGGRYHNMMQAIKLHEKYDVTIYTNRVPVFINDFKWYNLPTIEVCDIQSLDVEADVYFGSPEPGTLKSAELGKKYNKPIFWQVYDPPKWMEESDHVEPGEINRHKRNKQYIKENNIQNLKIIINTENSLDSYAEWYELPKDMFVSLHPPLNSRIIDLFDAPKQNWIYAASRIHLRKAWDETLMAFKPYSNDYQLHVISHTEGKLLQIAREIGIDSNSIVIHTQIPDLEKYAILSQCKAVISSSHFEGFGMFVTEGRAMGVPVACYDLPSIREVEGGIHRAEMGNVKELSEKLGEALKSKHKRYTDHNFDVIGDKLLSIVSEDKTEELGISVMMIVLNEEKYISEA